MAEIPPYEQLCFVVAPIGAEGSDTRRRSDDVLEYVIRPAAEECDLTALRADEIDNPGLITTDIINCVAQAAMVVADLAESNPNVFYELALRHALRLPYAQITALGQDLPFDVADTRTVTLDHRNLRSADEARQRLTAMMRKGMSDGEADSPITRAVELQSLRQSDSPAEQEYGRLLGEISALRHLMSGVEDAVQLLSLQLPKGRQYAGAARAWTVPSMADIDSWEARLADLRAERRYLGAMTESAKTEETATAPGKVDKYLSYRQRQLDDEIADLEAHIADHDPFADQ